MSKLSDEEKLGVWQCAVALFSYIAGAHGTEGREIIRSYHNPTKKELDTIVNHYLEAVKTQKEKGLPNNIIQFPGVPK